MFCFLFLAPYARTTRYEEAWKTKEKKARFARVPYDYVLPDIVSYDRTGARKELQRTTKHAPATIIN